MKCPGYRKLLISKSNRETYHSTPKAILERRAKKISISHAGKSTTGKVNWTKVMKIRQLWSEGKDRKYIHVQFSELTQHTVNDIISRRTWKVPVVPVKVKTDF